MWSAEVKEGLLRHHDMVLADVMGSSEGGMGSSVTTRDVRPSTAKFQLNEGVKVITDDGRFVAPGSGEIGRLATSGFVPLGYYKDPEKSAATFREVAGVRYSFPGDYATVEADGTITLLGRGSVCINTAGEKVFPEEVEEAVKRHPSVEDCLVVGVPDARFGERVVAVASTRDGMAGDPSALIEFTREHLAGYKVPKSVLFVERVQRAPNGKADYKWAKAAALAAESAH
jgi:fatty-acyl-CoA synthase